MYLMIAISVILNTYNSERFITKTIASVLQQTYTHFELLVIDDGSQDHTLDLLYTIATQDDRIRIHTYPNGGIAKSRNRGLSHATGEYVAFLDHDDLWEPQKLEQQLLALAACPDAGFAYSWVNMIDEGDHLIRGLAPVCYRGDIYLKILERNFIMTASNPLIKRDCLVKIGGFDEAIYGADDWDLFIRLAQNYPAVLSECYHIGYRVVAGSGSGQVAKMEAGCLQVVEKAFTEDSPKMNAIKRRSLGVMYQYFCLRTLEEFKDRKSIKNALNYLKISETNYPNIWRGMMPKLKIYIKIFLILLLPKTIAKKCIVYLARITHDQ